MNNLLKQLTSILLCVILVISLLFTVMSLFLQNTLLSENFYLRVTESPAYQFLLKEAIKNDLLTKSNFTAIPVEYLHAGLDDKIIDRNIAAHIENTASFFNFTPSSAAVDYPTEKFYIPLETFINNKAHEDGYVPSQEQYEMLSEVAEESAAIVEKHVKIINLTMVKDLSAFQRLHKLIYEASQLLLPALIVFILAAALMVLIYRRDWRLGLLYGLSSIWIAGSILAIPAIVTDVYALPRRLAIETPYLKYAIDGWLTYANRYILIWGVLLFSLATAGLAIRFFTQKHLRRKKNKRKTR